MLSLKAIYSKIYGPVGIKHSKTQNQKKFKLGKKYFAGFRKTSITTKTYPHRFWQSIFSAMLFTKMRTSFIVAELGCNIAVFLFYKCQMFKPYLNRITGISKIKGTWTAKINQRRQTVWRRECTWVTVCNTWQCCSGARARSTGQPMPALNLNKWLAMATAVVHKHMEAIYQRSSVIFNELTDSLGAFEKLQNRPLIRGFQ
ncbi:hypothetical protein T4C_12054 [Trichinella pseudospiralis]|uniref:Uncharacterized protein n=1 Tax=Trichinella pseudospiralis TaxID=6337 RepID=A0A0V1JRA9_TRIPS|nr:hypothetical protein T4C_12054 [Trichinella pseudospiralis]